MGAAKSLLHPDRILPPGTFQVLSVAVARGADPAAPDASGNTALMWAVGTDAVNPALLELLLASGAGAGPNTRTFLGGFFSSHRPSRPEYFIASDSSSDRTSTFARALNGG